MAHALQASIDLGTNTCLLLVLEGDRVLHDESTVVRLGQGVDQSGELHPEAMKRSLDCLIRYASIAKHYGVPSEQIVAVGTAQARDAKNARIFFDEVTAKTGIRFRVLSGDEEARATFIGAALPGILVNEMIVMDIGGGSTEIVAGSSGTSLNIGAVRVSERFFKNDPVTDAEFWAAENFIDEQLKTLSPWREGLKIQEPKLVTVAGTAVTLAMLQLEAREYRREELDGFVLTRGDAHRLVEELKWRSVAERKQMAGMEVKRADVILAGAMIYWRAMEVLAFPRAVISTRGLRYGVLAKEFRIQ
jgi:exopolyphosphatase/guanosine-5'-triphosphate,3'-diphosphate pyrophosphatase